MEVINDNNCSWINDLSPRTNFKSLDKNHDCDWLIIGAGYTGLSAARKLSELNPNEKIIVELSKSLIKEIKEFGQDITKKQSSKLHTKLNETRKVRKGIIKAKMAGKFIPND